MAIDLTQVKLGSGGQLPPLTSDKPKKTSLRQSMLDFMIGAGKSGFKTIKGGSSAFERYAAIPFQRSFLSKEQELARGIDQSQMGSFKTAAEKLTPTALTTAENKAQKVGMFAGEVAQFLAPGGIATKGAKFLGGGLLARGAAEALSAGGVALAQEGKFNPTVAMTAALGGVAPAGLSALKKVAFDLPKALFTTVGKAKVSGLTKVVINTVKDVVPKLENKTVRSIIAAAEKASESLSALKPRDIVGDVLIKAKGTLDKNLDDAGKVIDDFVSRSSGKYKDKISYDTAYQEFLSAVRGLNVKVTGKGSKARLNFLSSDVADLTADQKFLTGIFNKIKPLKDGSRSAFVRDVISFRRNIGNKIYKGTRAGELTSAEGVANKTYQSIKGLVDDFARSTGDDAFINANQMYSDSLEYLGRLTKSIGKDGENAALVVRRIFSNAGGKERQVLSELTSKADDLNLGFFKTFMDQAKLAEVAEQVFQVRAPRGLEAIVGRGAEVATGYKKALADTIGFLAQRAVGTTEENFVKLVAQEMKTAGREVTESAIRQTVRSTYGSFDAMTKGLQERAFGAERKTLQDFLPQAIDKSVTPTL